MKKFLLAIVGMLMLHIVHAQDKQAIAKALETQRLAWNRGDVEAYMQGYWKSDSLIFVGKSGPTYGWMQTLENYKKRYPGKAAMGELTFKVLKIEQLDANNAFMLGGWHLKRANDAPGGYFTLWYKKINGQWLIVCDHTS